MTISIGFLSTYPPTQCGIATFSASLVEGLLATRNRVAVVSIVDERTDLQPQEVVHQWVREQAGGATVSASVLNRQDIAIIEHEFGIFGGQDGVRVLDVLRELTVPVVTVMHTVLVTPSASQRAIVDALLIGSARIVVMTQAARQRLIEHYAADPLKVRVIPHGAPDARRFAAPGLMPTFKAQPIILTWGLLGRGKGIEWAIEAMALLKGFTPMPKYRVVGETHPKVVAREGESYRTLLRDLVQQRRLVGDVEFDARYLETPELFRIANASDIVLLPYDSTEQVTSGVLVEAVTAGKPVISTGFPHAVELLSSGAGIIVERQDPAAIAQAIRRILTEPGLSRRMTAEALRIAPDLLWPAVAAQYRELADELVGTLRPLAVSA